MKKINLLFFPLILALFAVHFHDQRSFKREFINYDDVEFIQPLKEISSAREYFDKRVFAKDAYGFPLRDLTLIADFRLSEFLGWKTFWLSNFVVYTLVLLVQLFFFRELFPGKPWWPITLVALIALHPVHLEMIQWASNRKHLLVALILSWGTLRVWRTYQAGASPNFKRWMEFITYYILAWLCWPSAVLWIFWPILLFFKKMSLKSRASVTALALVLAGAGVKWTVSQNTSYESSAPLNVLHGLSIALQSLGRGLYNIILPYRVAPYYTFNSWLNWIGAIGLLLIVVLLLKYKHQQGWKIKWGDPALMLFLLSALLFVPNAMVFLGYYEFVWADRYIYTPLPYLAAAIGAFWTSHAPIFKKLSVPPVWSRGAIALVLAVYVVLSWKLPASWETDKALFNRCALVEKAPKCIYLAVEKNYDINGCQDLSPLLKIAREARAISKVDFAFSSQLPLYEAICITQMRPTAEQKWAELESLKSVYSVTESLAVGEVWVHIQQRDLDSAFKTAQRTYLNGQRKFSDVSPKIVNVILGQMEALCDLSSNPQCLQSLNEFKERIRSAPRNELQMTWARNRTFEAYFTGR